MPQVLVAGALAAVMALGSTPAQCKPGAGKIVWQTNFERSMALAKKTGKPVFVDIAAEWCAPCQAMDEFVYPTASVIQASRPYIMVKVDPAKRPDLNKKYALGARGLGQYPALLFFSPSGRLVKRQLGPPSPPSAGKAQVFRASAVASELVRMLKTYSHAR